MDKEIAAEIRNQNYQLWDLPIVQKNPSTITAELKQAYVRSIKAIGERLLSSMYSANYGVP